MVHEPGISQGVAERGAAVNDDRASEAFLDNS
jgi:hypothetical protein